LQPTRNGRVAAAPTWEVDRIALVSEVASLLALEPPPVIAGFTPAEVAYGDPVTVSGSGFATPCALNDVRLDDQPQLVLHCAPDRITFEARGSGTLRLSVRTAGGLSSVPDTLLPLVLVGPPR
jgi:hypothetical protein